MAAATPSFSSSSRIAAGTIQTANTNRDGTGTMTTLLTGAAGGSRIERVRAKAAGTSTAGMVRLFLFNDSGVFVHMMLELTVSAITASNTVKTWEGDQQYGATVFLVIPANYTVRAATAIGEVFTLAVHITE